MLVTKREDERYNVQNMIKLETLIWCGSLRPELEKVQTISSLYSRANISIM